MAEQRNGDVLNGVERERKGDVARSKGIAWLGDEQLWKSMEWHCVGSIKRKEKN